MKTFFLFCMLVIVQISVTAQDNRWLFYNSSNSPVSNTFDPVAVTADKNNCYWFGESKLYRFDRMEFLVYDSLNSPVKYVSDLAVDKENNLLIGNYGAGLTVKKGNDWITYNDETAPFSLDNIFKVTVDKENRYWLGVPNGGVAAFKDSQWTYFTFSNSFNGIEDFNFIEADNFNNIWIGTDYFGLYVFNGTTWVNKIPAWSGSGPFTSVTSITFDTNNDAWVTINVGGSGEIWKMQDTSWVKYTSVDFLKNPRMLYSGAVTDQNNIKYFGTDMGLLVYSSSGWSFLDSLNAPLPGNRFSSGYVDNNNNKIFSISSTSENHGIVFYNENGVQLLTDLNSETQLMQDYSLGQNYPNPFNPSTTIIYHLGDAGHTKVYISSLLGKVISVLVDGVNSAGHHQVVLEPEKIGLGSGVYFYTIVSGKFTETKKMVYLK